MLFTKRSPEERMLKFQNTLSGKLEEFQALVDNHVRIYFCGPTVYAYAHIGNFRSILFADVLRRYLKFKGYAVTHVMNITDVEDRIIKFSREAGVPMDEFTAKYIEAFWQDFDDLGCERPEHTPRATRHIPEMVSIIKQLEERGHAYVSDDSIYYRISSFPEYGKLSKINFAGNIAGGSERIDTDRYEKEDARDFALWKGAGPEDQAWDTSLGRGRPGWHIECSAMSMKYLGETFDVHVGGVDLIFPHHENEIAQSEGATGKPFVKYWLHNGFLRVDDEKMSKSLGNFFVVRDVLKRYDPEVVRFFLLRSHYRSPLNYTDANLEEAKQSLTRLYTALQQHPPAAAPVDWNEPHAQRFRDAMNDDFGTPEAVAELHQLANRAFQGDARAAGQLKALGGVLGLLQREPREFLQAAPAGVAAQWIEERIAARRRAREQKNFAEADRIRQELLDRGIVLEDKGAATTWRRV